MGATLRLPQRRLIHQRDLFAQLKDAILPIALGVEPRERLFEGGIIPALREPRRIMDQAQRA